MTTLAISDDDAREIARAAQLEIKPPQVGGAAEVAVAGQGSLVEGRQRRPATVDALNLSSRPKGDIYGIDARANRGANHLTPAATEQAEALS
jgi:hypothetical protein